MLDRKDLVVNRDYQRGSGLWPIPARSYFIDTIIEEYPFPKIYMYEYMDKAVRGIRKEIVDGQQRISAITSFYNNEFSLQGDGPNKGKKFSDLDDDLQERFLSYSVSVDVIRNAKRSQILQMFRRMNAFTMPLNEAEKRHSSFHGSFKWFVNDLSDELNEFFIEFGVFTSKQVTRMADSTLISDCVLSLERGIVSTNGSDLKNLYEKYDDNFPNADEYRRIIIDSFEFIAQNLGELRKSYMMKPYALQSLFTGLAHNRFRIKAIQEGYGVEPIGAFAADPALSAERLLALANAHEGKETEGPHARYVWGCLSTTDRRPRRTARVAAILRALGAAVPDAVDAHLT